MRYLNQALVVAIICDGISTQISYAQLPDPNAVVTKLRDQAVNICSNPSQYGYTVQAGGRVQGSIQTSKIVKLFSGASGSADIGGAATRYQGIAQAQLPGALQTSDTCRIEALKIFKDIYFHAQRDVAAKPTVPLRTPSPETSKSSDLRRLHNHSSSADETPNHDGAANHTPPQDSPSRLVGFDDSHAIQEGTPADGHAYKYTPLGCDWRASKFGFFDCRIWIEADGDLMISRLTNRPRLEMADGSVVRAVSVELTSDTTGPGYKGKLLGGFNFNDLTSKGLPIDRDVGQKSVLLQIDFPTLDVGNARAVIFSLGAGDTAKRISIVPPS